MGEPDTCIPTTPFANETYGGVVPVLEKYETALLLLLGFGGASLCLAILHKSIRRHVFHDADNVDTAFDAGGKVSTSLTAVTVASQLLWPADLLQGATITVKNIYHSFMIMHYCWTVWFLLSSGISGPLWYTVGAALNIALFPILSVHLKTRAPGAKTYLQIMHARFGKPAHLVFCCMALLVNALALTTLLVAGFGAIQSLTNDASDEFCVIVMATLFGCYSFVGGLGTTFYVSYFNAVLIFSTLVVLLVKILYTSGEEIGGLEMIYEKLQCLIGPDGNEENSYLTFRSENGWVFAVMAVCLTSSLTYCDQASWQSRIAAKPLQGVLGFLIATYMWFAIPSSIAATTGLTYLSLGVDNASQMMSMKQVDEGLVTPFIAQHVLGATGGVLVLTMVAMALMSTGSGEVMAVSSIIVYDIYQIYIKPFRKNVSLEDCILCGKRKKHESQNLEDMSTMERALLCSCPAPDVCESCAIPRDVPDRLKDSPLHDSKYLCPHHGDYRYYQEELFRYKSWCILWVTIALVPFGLLVRASGIDLNWMMLFGFVVTIPCFPPVALAIFYSKTTGKGVISGAVSGIICGVSASLALASTYDGGLRLFMKNTVQNNSILAGSCTSLGVSFLVTLFVSLATTRVKGIIEVEREWHKLRSIDNPLHPWSDTYKDDFPDLKTGEKPKVEALDKMFRKARNVAYIGGAGTLVLFVGVIPAVMTSLHVLSLTQFKVWMYLLQAMCFSMAAVVVVVAPVEEVIIVYKQFKKNKSKAADTKQDIIIKESYEMTERAEIIK